MRRRAKPLADGGLKARRAIGELVSEVDDILKRAYQDDDLQAARARLRRWIDRASASIGRTVNSKEGERFSKLRKGSFISGQQLLNLSDEVQY
jgi:hypothetical protein